MSAAGTGAGTGAGAGAAEGERVYDLTIFGATGFTGKYILDEVLKTAPKSYPGEQQPIRIAIAGRSRAKLERLVAALPTTGQETANCLKVDIIVADAQDERSMRDMCRVSKVIIAAAGPYMLIGEAVISACIQEHTSYIDISGESEFIETMMLKYHKDAKDAQVTIVHACGFDSIPADMGLLYIKQQMVKTYPGSLPVSVEIFCKLDVRGEEGFGGHCTSFQAGLHNLEGEGRMRQIQKTANRPELPKFGPLLQVNLLPHWNTKVEAYTVPLFLVDPLVMELSQQLILQDNDDQHDLLLQLPAIQVAAYACIPTFAILTKFLLALVTIGLFAQLRVGRELMLKYPGWFTWGVASHEGPSEEQMKGTSFVETFFARGYSKALREACGDDGEELCRVQPDVELVTSVSGPEPGYVATPKLAVQAAYTVLWERDRIPRGVLTPAVAFARTRLIERLIEQGIVFSSVVKK